VRPSRRLVYILHWENAELPYQVDDPFQYQILLRNGRPDCERLGNKAPDIAVNRISVTGPDTTEDLLGMFLGHIASSHPKDAIQNDR
jgi:hypothetical protein